VPSIGELREALVAAIKLSMQSSYQRRAPAKESVPRLIEVRNELRRLVVSNPKCAEAWQLLSQAEESLLDYERAIASLNEAILLSGKRDRRMLKRRALLQESLSEWSAMPLSGDELRELGEFLATEGADQEIHGRTLEVTKRWLQSKGYANAHKIIEALRDRGGYTDFTVFHNVVRG
jgi:hypothetical protein